MRAVVKRLMFQGWIGKIGRIGYLLTQTREKETGNREQRSPTAAQPGT